jgi:Putative transposase
LPSADQNAENFNNWMSSLYEISWYVYLQKPSDDHKRNIEYLGRYIKRLPISETRIENYDGKQVKFKFLDHYNNTIDRITMPVIQFIASLVMHIPDRYFRMIRYYVFLSNRTRGVQLPIVYKAINQIVHKKTKLISWRLMI